VLWISGDTVLYDGVRDVARRLEIGTAIVHLGGVRFPISGPLRYTMTASEAAELCGLIVPRTIVPIHYEGWKHFREGRDAAERAFADAPGDLAARVKWLELGVPATLSI
jgi:L-ascorbate metabolism protein UlaG (beta-lactamase superfamily)